MKLNLLEDYIKFKPEFASKKDCFLVAFCACYNVSYEEAKLSGIKTELRIIQLVLRKKGAKEIIVPRNTYTLYDLSKKLSSGIYYVILEKKDDPVAHAVALIDGIIYDGWDPSNWGYVRLYYVINQSRANYETAYVNDPDKYKNYAIDYILDNYIVSDDDKLKIENIGTNGFILTIGLNSVEFNFLLNQSDKDCKIYIEKLIQKYWRLNESIKS